jgi:histidyl-tRNA synthetase
MSENAKPENAAPKASMEPYKGVRDFYPEDMFIEDYIFSTMREVSERFGYGEYGASILEPTELYASKTSEEIVNDQTYTFTDRGERSVTLRPEMTPTVARMVAARYRELPFPLRLFSIPNVFRYERPQKGRLREHWQLNCDIFGIASMEAEVEIISLAYHIMRAFGAAPEDFLIKVNDRRTLYHVFSETIGLSEGELAPFLSLLDKRDKMEGSAFDEEARTLIGTERFERFLAMGIPERSIELDATIEMLADLGITNVVYDPSLIRGFSYYTGTIFEVFDTSPENKRSLFGGGRYDNLMQVFGVEKIPAVGFGMGDVTIRDFLETRNLIPPYSSVADLMLLVLERSSLRYALELAQNLRDQGVHVAVDFTFRKVGDQIKAASKSLVPFVSVIGEVEKSTKTLRLKDLASGEETEMPEGAIAEFIFGNVK